MAHSEAWIIGDDGSLTVGEESVSITYHSGLNIVLVTTKSHSVKVIDIPSGIILRDCALSGLSQNHDGVQCSYVNTLDRVVYCDGRAVGIRKDLSGVLLLDTALQTRVKKAEDHVYLELLLPEANSLLNTLMTAELPGVDYVDDVLRELEKEIESARQSSKGNHKQSKWSVVCLKLPHCALKTVCRSLVDELKRQNDRKPGLATAAAVFDRLQCLLPKNETETTTPNGVVDRALMYSEAARRETFSKWPHMNYKWALPIQMAQAGFYHQPAATGDDRALCFTCNVCLVCWEPTDEPWSEHERHSPQCPFVKGEFTQNVPCAASYAAEPAHYHGSDSDTVHIECISTTSSSDYIASSSIHGNIVVWDTNKQLKKHIEFNVDPWESIIAAKTGTGASVHALEPAPKSPRITQTSSNHDAPSTQLQNTDSTDNDAANEETDAVQVAPSSVNGSAENQEPGPSGVVILESGPKPPSTTDSSHPANGNAEGEDKAGKAEVIEVGGAWKVTLKEHSAVATSVEGDIVEIPLENEEPKHQNFGLPQRRCRPSFDVLVSSLCVLSQPPQPSESASGACAAPLDTPSARPCLVTGVAIRRTTGGGVDMLLGSENEENSEVQALNQVNQAITEDSQSRIISQNLTSSDSSTPNPFVPYLLIHDISSLDNSKAEENWKNTSRGGNKMQSASGNVGGKQWSSSDTWKPMPLAQGSGINLVQQSIKQGISSIGGMYPPVLDELDTDDEDQVQIIDVIAPPGTKNVSQHPYKFGSVPQLVSFHDSKKADSSNNAKGSNSQPGVAKASVKIAKEGQVLQCIELPNQIGNDHYVRSITPTLDGKYVIVGIAPRCLNRKLELIANNQQELIDMVNDTGSAPVEGSSSPANVYTNGGYLLLYKVTVCEGAVMLSSQPEVVSGPLPAVNDAVINVGVLPVEAAQAHDDDESFSAISSSTRTDGGGPDGQIAVTTKDGRVKLLDICDFRVLATISAPNEEEFVSVTYCSGIDRLCCCTKEGRLFFYTLRPSQNKSNTPDTTTAVLEASPTKSEDVVDSAPVVEPNPSSESLLVKQQLSMENLTHLHELTQYENLVPRYSATVPQCWNEIQQEQQQRRHPQHLHQHGEASKHTRSWKLQQDGSSWDEHVFEVVLPRPSTVGHVDLKFSLHPMCTSPPQIQATLYKQKSSSFSRKVLTEETATHGKDEAAAAPVDAKIDFKLGADNGEHEEVKKTSCEQLQEDCAEVVCGPLDLANHVDMSGRNGILTLTSPQLMKLKTKTLMLHLKAVGVSGDKQGEKEKTSSKKSEDRSSKSKENSPLPGTLAAANSETGKVSEAYIKQKLESVKGCDWLNEISITIRRNKLASVPNPRAQRMAMLETTSFHEQLLIVACGLDVGSVVSACEEHKQKLALDILSWVLAVQVCDITQNKIDPVSVVDTIQANLRGLVKAAYIESGRSLAHQCTKLITQCLDYTKSLNDVTPNNRFTMSLHSALLECLPFIPSAKSAGALKWFFTLLNRVKLVDSGATGHLCTSLLSSVAQQYSERHSTLHSLLKTRYGLYGHPFDPELFDIDPPLQARSTSNGSPSYAAAVNAAASNAANNANTNNLAWSAEDFDSKELLSLTNSDKINNSSALNTKLHADLVTRHVCGLLEVEPLHYSISGTSDGTKVEKLDTSPGVTAATGTVSGLAGGTMNFGENVSSTAGAALASLSSAMATAEAEVQKLQQKQLQLIKLQQQKYKLEQKLAETSKNSPSAANYSGYNSELFPPTPKNTPFFMTPPLTPPNEAFVNLDPHIKHTSKASSGKDTPQPKSALVMPNVSNLFQAPPAQALVVERMSSVSTLPGARRYVVLDFGKPILLSDVIVPACLDLASLSIDVWTNSEEADGHRLVVTSDIGLKSLVLNDLSPPIICRYLKVTTIGRYGGNATKSKIPIGCFYGHTFMLPWEQKQQHNQSNSQSKGQSQQPSSSAAPALNSVHVLDQSQIISQIGVYISLQEDIQCRYSLACNRLESLLMAVEAPQGGGTHTQYYLKKVKKNDEDNKIYQAYHECMSLQLQLNVAQRAIERLQKALGVCGPQQRSIDLTPEAGVKVLQTASTDRLRVLCELLLDCVMSITFPAVSHPPVSLYTSVTPALCEDLFKHLCVHGSKKMQMYTGLFLVRVCGCQAWWGRFLGNMLQQYFIAEQPHVFPQDRVFLLLVSLGQRSLTSNKSCEILESILMMLANILSPLIASQAASGVRHHGLRSLDLTLIGWLLLFLSKCLDHVGVSAFESSVQKNGASCAKDIPIIQNRWDFLQGEAAMHSTKSSGKASPSKMFRRKLQKRLMHTKQQLLDFQKAKVAMDNQEKVLLEKAEKSMLKKAKVLMKTADSCMQQLESQEALKQQLKMSKESLLKQYSAKHFKDVINLRKTDAETLRKLTSSETSGATGGGVTDKDGGGELPGDPSLQMARERCIPVIRGLVALLLSMDFTCNVDLFIIASKVIARITQLTRPAICLSEVVSQEELEQLIMLMCNIEYNNGNVSWGGAWAGHAITCLLQDILEGERLSPQFENGLSGLTDDEALASSTISETDESLQNSTTLPTVDDESSSQASLPSVASKDNLVSEGENNNTMNSSYNDDKENWLEMILAGQDTQEDLFPFKPKDLLPPPPGGMTNIPKPVTMAYSQPPVNPFLPPSSYSFTGTSMGGSLGAKSSSGTKNLGAQPNHDWWQSVMTNSNKKLQGCGCRLTDYLASKAGISTAVGQGVSTAMDVRLEYGLEMPVEMKLRLMMTMEALRVHNALTAPIPQPSSAAEGVAFTSCQQTDDEQITEATLLSSIRQMPVVPSSEMLSCCFNNLFMQLPMQRINLDALLQVWLTLNEDTTQEENGVAVFDPGRMPSIPLSPAAVTSLLTALGWAPSIPVRTWVLAFQVLSLVINQKLSDGTSPRDGTSEQCMATLIVSNSNLMDVLVKFLSGTSAHGPVMSSSHQLQVGPTATKCFQQFLQRITMRSPNDTYNNFKELLLKLLYVLASESTRGALHSYVGPQDAQCKLVEYMAELNYDQIDVSNAISVIEAITKLVYQHIISQDRVVCKSSSESSVSARSCFGGLIGNVLRTGDSKSSVGDCSRDTLMCSLLKLVNMLVQLPLPAQAGGSGPNRRRAASNVVEGTPIAAGGADVVTGVDSPLTDTSKISQGFGGEGSGMVTSTPTVALSDEEKRQQTDEQETEAGATSTPILTPKPKSCTHFADILHPELEETRENTLGYIVLSHYQTVMHLIQALSSCSSNTMAMILGSSMRGSIQDTFAGMDPISVGDGIFQILCSLNRKASDLKLILKPLHDYLSCSLLGSMSGRMCRLSEPLLWFMLRVLDCPHAIRTFMDMGGIQVLCESLVKSTKQVINTAPSLVSTMMYNLGTASKTSRKLDTDAQDQLINFAPLGTVSSSSPKAGPAEILIGATPPHRRARSAAFSYHFYPDEMWMDLTISLPCSVVLKEVHIQPHVSSLATCPAAVSLEVSRDGMACVPICSPQSTSGFTTIKLQLLKPEVVTAVTIRLHRPLDSNSVGLSQIRLMGNTAFGETGIIKSSNFFTPVEDYVSRTSVGWLRLLHHCLCHCDDVAAEVAMAAAPTPNLLATCSALLLSPSAIVYDHNIEQVLLKIGLHSEEMGLCLIDYLLTGSSRGSGADTVPAVAMHGHRGGMANESTIDILYHLGVTQDSSTEARVQALCEWLEKSAIMALQKNSSGGFMPAQGPISGGSEIARAAPGHVQCVAAVLWQSKTSLVRYNLQGLISKDLLRVLYEWSSMTACDSALKQAIDAVICSLCYIQPQHYYMLLQWTGVLQASRPLTDDSKDERQQLGPLTDDTKADNEAQLLAQPITDDVAASRVTPSQSGLADLNHMSLDESHLSSLAMASQSPEALQRLLDTGFLSVLCQAVFDFCTHEMSKYVESLMGRESMTDASKSASTSPRGVRIEGNRSRTQSETSQPQTEQESCLSPEQASEVLRFLAEIAKEAGVKDWLGGQENSAFWPVLLNLLCTTPANMSTQLATNVRMLSSTQRSRLETETINFFKQAIVCHQENQLRFANVLCDVMRTTGLLGQSSALSGFMRRLFLQVLLEDEKVLVGVQSHTQMYKGSSFTNASRHPRCGAGHKYRAVMVSLNSTCAEILHKISDTASLSDPADKNGKASSSDTNKDITEIGLQMVNSISQAAGISAQEKRNKSSAHSGHDSLPPRPPSRRGHRPPAALSAGLVAPALHLFHTALPAQPLPGDLTLAQLYVMLQVRGYDAAQNFFQFKMKLRSKLIEECSDDDNGMTDDVIPDSVLLETSSSPTALQVFASVGGLSLLAEHLPVLYPEVSRVSGTTEENTTSTNKGLGSVGSPSMMGHDWVTVESADELYDIDGGEQLLPLGGPNRDKKQMASTTLLPTIPPHSLVSFGVFLRLPGYAEVLLKERRKAQCLLRLVLGVTDDGEGGHILSSPVASSLPTLPFTVLRSLCDSTPLSTDDGVLLRRMTLEIGVIHLLLACLSVLSHHAPRHPIPGFHQEVILAAMQTTTTVSSTPKPEHKSHITDEKSQQYWAKGTGFGTGSTISSWDAEQSMLRQRSEEEHVTCLVQVLASFINPGGHVPEEFHASSYSDEEAAEKCSLPTGFPELLTNSCLVPAICSYIRNDSVLDMSRHIPLYRALLELLRGVSVCPPLVHLLLPLDKEDESSVSIVELLEKMKTCVDTYASRLKSNKGKNGSSSADDKNKDVEDSEGLALLIPDIQATAKTVYLASQRLKQKTMELEGEDGGGKLSGAAKDDHSAEDRYLLLMKKLQFDTYEMVMEDDNGSVKFTMPHHYESNVKSAGDVNNAARARRLAQEAVTLSTSLPLSYNSTVFVRCDEERLDVMKVLITGPSDTPYGNGCFEFDVYFPQDYPNSPPLVNLETTGNRTVRFNPNLYNDGKVCLSVLNTWHGRPEEKWNAQTSSFLQVLVSIQSLILVSEPYFNEPGYERSRGTPSGTASSREYDANIRQATVKWAMLEMLRNAPACFKQVIQSHMWMKRHEICSQVETWIQEMEGFSTDKRTGRSIAHSLVALKRHYSQLREEYAKMKTPPELEDDEEDSCMDSSPTHSADGVPGTSSSAGAPNGLNTPLSNSSSSTGTFSDSVTSSSTESGLSQEMNPTVNKYTVEHGQIVSDNGKSNSHVEMNHVGEAPPPSSHVPISNGDMSEDMASMFLGPEEEHVPNLQSTDNIMFL